MSPTTQQFAWKDRDTAARDLLQLVYHAPEVISQRALELLSAIRSPAIVPELLDYVRDEDVWYRGRSIALEIVAISSHNIYLPELKQHLEPKETSWDAGSYLFHATVNLVKRHPSNRGWLAEALDEQFAFVETLPLDKQRNDLVWLCLMYRDTDGLGVPVHDRLMRLLEAHPDLFNLVVVTTICFLDKRSSTRIWLTERWKIIEDLSISEGGMLTPVWSYEFSSLMEHWKAWRQHIFALYPNLVPQYETYINESKARRIRNYPPLDVTQAPLWQETEASYKQALNGDRRGQSELSRRQVMSTDMLEKAVATHFYAKILGRNPDDLWRLIDLLHEGAVGWRWSDQWLTQNLEDLDLNVLYTPVQFELGDELRSHPSPRAWNALVNAYFFAAWPHRPYFIDWIAYQTDRLSGLEVEYTGATLDIEDRPWFRALVEQEQQAE